MTPERLAKIRALAEHPSTNPRMREIAKRILNEHWTPPPNKPNPGTRTSEEYDRFIFMDLDNWGQSASGNYVHTTKWENRDYRFVLFKHKKTPTWGWLRVDIKTESETWSRNKYATLREAHESAWLHLSLL